MIAVLEELLETDAAGDPMGRKRRWCRRSTRSLSEELAEKGMPMCPNSVGKMLKVAGFSLRCCRKSIAETKHPDRDRQFRIIAEQRKRFEDLQQPIISVDTKKRELVGNFSNKGQRYRREPDKTLSHDFPSYAEGVAIPYGIYEVLTNLGTVVVGTSYDTPEFAVDAIRTWLATSGFDRYGAIRKLLIFADTGGSNGAHPRLWKHGLYHSISKVYGIDITVCHYPSGASKWNPVEHRLFSQVSSNWQGEPLRSHELILGFIGSTKTTTGLRVQAVLNDKQYQRGIRISDSQMRTVKMTSGDALSNWNYTIG
jgi:hypothetical protein